MKKKILLMSLGGQPKPLIKSILHFKPEYIYFLASHQSSIQVAEIIKETNFPNKQQKIVLVDDPNDLDCCYMQASKIQEYLTDMDRNEYEIIVDYTGGTKNMSAALALASIEYGYSYGYVGGEQRTKDGLGIVQDGCEKIYHAENPWDKIAHREKQQLAALVNEFMFFAAVRYIDLFVEKTSSQLQVYYRDWQKLFEGLAYWDQLQYSKVLPVWSKVNWALLRNEASHMQNKAQLAYLNFLEHSLMVTIKRMQDSKKGKNKSGNQDKPAFNESMLFDMIGNAERRAFRGQYDDAVLRLYRAIEMVGQIGLQNHGVDDACVRKQDIPEAHRENFWTKSYVKHDDKSGFEYLALGLERKFELLDLLGDPLGSMAKEYDQDFRRLQFNRNQSKLIHGSKELSQEAYETCLSIVKTLVAGYNQQDLPRIRF